MTERKATPLAIETTLEAPIAAKPVREPRISKRIREVVRLLLTGECKTIKAAGIQAGMNANYLSSALKRPEVRVFVERRSRDCIAAGTLRASARMLELIDAGSEHVSFDASAHVLGIAGIKPATEPAMAVNVNIQAGFVIDISEPDTAEDDRARRRR